MLELQLVIPEDLKTLFSVLSLLPFSILSLLPLSILSLLPFLISPSFIDETMMIVNSDQKKGNKDYVMAVQCLLLLLIYPTSLSAEFLLQLLIPNEVTEWD